jgi:3-oxoacyl-[acyl-carrier protein] reductase
MHPVADLVTHRLAGRVVMITGAESGIGRATALRAAGEGAAIAAIGLDAAALSEVIGEIRSTGGLADSRVADVSDPEQIGRAVEALVGELGELHVAYANAGILLPAVSLDELDLDAWNRVLGVDLTGVLLTFRAAVPHIAGSGGVLLATGSSLALKPGVGQLSYAAAKAGVHAIVRSLALELAPRNIRANVIAPGLTDTPMTTGIAGHIERGLPSVPLGVLVQADEVAALAVHLMTDDARSVTGSVFSVDGGRSAA